MHPDLYLVLYRQQERELEQRLLRRLQQTCCSALAGAGNSRRAALARPARRSVRTVAVCCAV